MRGFRGITMISFTEDECITLLNYFKKTYTVALLAITCSLGSLTAQATIMFNPIFDDVLQHTGKGFDDHTLLANGLTLGQQRQETLGAVFDYLNTVLDEHGKLDLEIRESEDTGSGFLAYAGSYYNTSLSGFQSGFAFEDITTGSNSWPSSSPDATATFDFGYTLNSGLGAPTAGEYDLFGLALHEMGHVLGIRSLLNENGSGYTTYDIYSTYDSHLVLRDGAPLFNGAGQFIGTPNDLVSNDVYFSGTYANAANGGAPVALYAPSTWQQGSSISHLDDRYDRMFPNSYLGEELRTYSAVDLGILQDLGYRLYSKPVSVPEPSSLVLFALGNGLLYVFSGISWRRDHFML
jgi:hypothetical protein